MYLAVRHETATMLLHAAAADIFRYPRKPQLLLTRSLPLHSYLSEDKQKGLRLLLLDNILFCQMSLFSSLSCAHTVCMLME
jgi:hypothetical protein